MSKQIFATNSGRTPQGMNNGSSVMIAVRFRPVQFKLIKAYAAQHDISFAAATRKIVDLGLCHV